MKTYKLKLEVFENNKKVLNLSVDESACTEEMANRVLNVILEDSGIAEGKRLREGK